MKYVYLLFLSLFTPFAASAQNCPTLVVPTIRISQVGFPNEKANASFCQSERVQLNALSAFPDVAYQWKRDGTDIPGATSSILVVNQAGAYTVTLTQSAPCTGSVSSVAINITTNQCGSGGLLPILGGQLEDYNGGASTLNAILLRAVYLTDASSRNKFPLSIKAYVYRKRDKSLITTVTMSRGSILDGQYTPLPAACNGDTSKIQDVLYFGSINFLQSIYNDPDGYFATTEPICCRQLSDNISGTGSVVFYIEFGDRSRYNLTDPSSTFGSIFGLPSRIETCVNQPLQLASYSYIRANLNQVSYSLTTPTMGDATTPVKDVTWSANYAPNTFLESSTPLRISSNGTITSTPTKVGTFRYAVKAELFQGSFKAFELRRELAIQVKECPAVATPTIVVSAVGKPNQPVPAVICENTSIQLNAKAPVKNVDYQWYVDGRAINGATDSVLITPQAGRYTVMIYKELACPRSAMSSPVSLTVSRNPGVSLTVSNTTGAVCQGTSLTLTAVSSVVGGSYRWLRDTTYLPTATGTTYETGTAGNYVVTVTDANGCSSRSPITTVAISLPPDAIIRSGPRSICPGSFRRLEADVGNSLSFQWIKDGVPIVGATASFYDATAAGFYQVVVKSANSCTAISVNQPLSIVPASSVGITGPTQVCRTSSVTLTATATLGAIQYQWLLNGSALTGAVSSNLEAQLGGSYQVRITDTNQCTAISDNWVITEIDKVSVRLDSIPPICGTATAAVPLHGSPGNGVFSGNGVTGNQFSPSLSGIGSHEIVYTITGPTTCQSGTAKRTVLVNPIPEVQLPREVGIQYGESVTLSAPVGTNYQYSWSPPAGLDNPAGANPIATPDTTTLYRLIVRDGFGCTGEGSTLVFVRTQLYIPDAFSPNGDRYNDTWEIRNIARFRNVEVTVYNRWGEIVFHSLGYTTPFDGQDLQDGVYTYSITYDTPLKRLIGKVVLAR